MDRKGQMDLGKIVMIFIVAIVGLTLFVVIAQEVGRSRDLAALANETISTPSNGTAFYFTDYRLFSSVIITNATSGDVINSNNYTIANNVIDPTTGGLAVSLTPQADCPEFCDNDWNVSATAQTVTYIAESGARTVAGLITLLFALAIAIVVMIPSVREELFNLR